ncbi:MAG: nitroreductase [Dehalococcoidales bacterium]|nr:nitroreductase [Dehalococcoidales bacterium]
MDISEAIRQRHSTRAFKPDPVPQNILKEIMEQSLQAPSWANTQPWKLVVAGGPKLEAIKQAYVKKADEPANTDIPRPPAFPEYYDTRRRGIGEKMLEIKGIKREDRERRARWQLQGLQLFGAPCAIYICIDRFFYMQGDKQNVWPLFDCGMIAQSIMLLATKHGLGTVPQIQAVSYPDVLRQVLEIPDSVMFALGIAIGYEDPSDPINKFRSVREAPDKVIQWYGFKK